MVHMNKVIQKAAQSRGKVEIIYLSEDRQISRRIIKVLGVTDKHVKAYCYAKKKFRTFMLENILSVIPILKRTGA